MKAVYIKEFGGPENLEIREVPDPTKPEDGEVLIRVRAAGLNRADLVQRRGHYPPPPGYSPNIPGLEFAGEVVDTGDAVIDFNAGDRVFGITAGEAQAEFLKIDHCHLSRVPENLSFVEAGAIPEAFITAHDAVFTQARLKGEETLLVHAAGSGVGLAAVQLAEAYGHRVIGTSRTADKLERCREFGLDDAIVVQSQPNFAEEVLSLTEGRGVDVILDLVGGVYFEQNLRSLALKGRLMLVGLTGGSKAEIDLGAALSKRVTVIGTVLRGRSVREKAEATAAFAMTVIPMLASGAVRPVIDRVFDFNDVRSAHEHLESNKSFGKVLLEFGD
ncbi:MAG: NAD(P)H-quinone oxidoreductase [Acidobacteriota bacterium]